MEGQNGGMPVWRLYMKEKSRVQSALVVKSDGIEKLRVFLDERTTRSRDERKLNSDRRNGDWLMGKSESSSFFCSSLNTTLALFTKGLVPKMTPQIQQRNYFSWPHDAALGIQSKVTCDQSRCEVTFAF